MLGSRQNNVMRILLLNFKETGVEEHLDLYLQQHLVCGAESNTSFDKEISIEKLSCFCRQI